MIYIVGSGLSAVAAAVALVKRGFQPAILDPALGPDSEAIELKQRLSAAEPEDWTPADLGRLKRIGPESSSGIPRKLHFGSSFSYRDIDPVTSAETHHASIVRSFADGGFSNVWGAVIAPWSELDLRRWPIETDRMANHYETIRRMMGASTERLPSSQGRAIYRDYARHRAMLERRGVRLSFAELAVRTADSGGLKGCRHCGMCLYGCPYESIFSAAAHLDAMERSRRISRIRRVIVDRVAPSGKGVRIDGRCAISGTSRTFEGRIVFLAAGLLESARIVLNSTQSLSRRLRVQQSDTFTAPLLRYSRSANISAERTHTLCQTVMEIDDPAICARPVQLQLYGYNDLYARIMSRRSGWLRPILRPLFPAVAERTMVAFGYLHSDVSSKLWIEAAGDPLGRLRICGEPQAKSRNAARAVVRKLFQIRNYIRAIPVPLQLGHEEPGGGHRSAGSFPMSRRPAPFETDPWGRLPELPQMHIVDASVLPAAPAGPIAFTVMANAHRIASDCSIVDVA